MKKRIIALILVVVMSALALFGCGEYDYSDAKLEKFSSVDKAALLSALANLEIEDEDEFSVDSEKRKKELHDIVLRSLLNADNADDEEYKEGTPDYADALYYCYFAKYVDENDVEHIFMLPKTEGKTDYAILAANKTYLQFGISENADDVLTDAIEKAFAGKDIKDLVYSLDTNIGDDGKAGSGSLKVAAGDTVLLTFTYKTAEGVEKTITNLYYTIPTEAPTVTEDAEETELKSLADLKFFEQFLWDLVGKNVGKQLTITGDAFKYTLPAAEVPEGQDGDSAEVTEKTVSYTKINVSGVVKGGAVEAKVEYPDEDDKKLKNIFGDEINVKGKEVTYFVLPTHFKKVDYVKLDENSTATDYINNAKAILTVFYGSASIQDLTDENGKTTGEKLGALDIFSNEDYKITYIEGEGEDAKEVTKTFKELMEEFVELQKAYETAKAAYDKALEAFEKAEDALETAQKNYDNALEAWNASTAYLEEVKAAQKRIDDAQAALDAFNEANPDAAEDDAEKVALTAELEAAKKAFEDENYDLEMAEQDVKEDEEVLKGKADDEDDKGVEGKLADAKTAYTEACEALGHVNAEGDDCKCDKCETAYDHIDENNDCKCDRCEAALDDHVDIAETKDCKCDQCGADMEHVDSDDDDVCDTCGAAITADEDGDDHDHEEAKDATTALNEARTARDEFVDEKLLKATKEKGEDETEEPKAIAEAIVDEFDKSVYDVLEETYFEAINDKIMKEVYSKIDKYIIVDRDKLPRKAVNEMYDKIYEGHKYDFFTSASYADSTYNYYDQYEGDFEAYLMVKTGTSSFKAAKAALKEEAKDYVEEIVKIYRAAEVFNLVYTDEEFEADYEAEYNETTALIWEYYYGMEYMTEQDLHIAKQADKLFNALFATNKDSDGKVVVNDDNIFGYKMIKYTIKTSDEA